MSSPIYKVGDRVIRNNIKIQDSNAIPENSLGTVVHVDGKDSDGYLYIVNWDTKNSNTYFNYDHPNTWAIYEGCLDFIDNLTQEERKQQAVIRKIKYLNERYANSRTVSPKVGDQKPRESAASITGDQPEPPRVPSLEGRVLDALIDAHHGLYASVPSTVSVGGTYRFSTHTWRD